MNNFIKKFIGVPLGVLLLLLAVKTNAQAILLQNAVDKLEGYRNFSYQYVEKTLDYTNDTTIKLHKDLFQKATGDKDFGYLFSLETRQIGSNYHAIDLYNGQNLILISPDDSTYQFEAIPNYKARSETSTLAGFLKWLKGRPEKKPSEITRDTTIKGAICSHLVFDIYDTVINKEHCYAFVHVFINKRSGLPADIIIKERVFFGKLTNYYTEYRYSNYKFDQDIDIAAMTIPNGFHPPKIEAALPLLAPGTIAPGWTLTTTEGKQLSLAQLKGKVVLIDFFFIGCGACMESLSSLDKIYEKYKDRDFVMVSISNHDGRKALTGFKKKLNIKNIVCGDGADVAKLYHLSGAPLFYCIDKEGKIADARVGYTDDFEAKTISMVGNLLGK